MTKHCLKRSRERIKLSRHAACKMVTNVATAGYTSDAFPAKERRYLEGLELDGKQVMVYGGYCFLFGRNSVCITVFHVPRWFGKKYKYDGKMQIREPKKYQRFCTSVES